MREILFRAKRIDNGEWVSGYYVYDYAHNAHFIFKNQFVCPNCINDRRIDYSVCDYEIDPDTLCQYTGLKDKNGNRIWENDIVVCKQYIDGNFIDYHIEFGFVEMKHGAYGLHRDRPDAYYRPFKDWLEDYEYEVLGNIFDNPELLKGGLTCRN